MLIQEIDENAFHLNTTSIAFITVDKKYLFFNALNRLWTEDLTTKIDVQLNSSAYQLLTWKQIYDICTDINELHALIIRNRDANSNSFFNIFYPERLPLKYTLIAINNGTLNLMNQIYSMKYLTAVLHNTLSFYFQSIVLCILFVYEHL